jgi:hypothetical protein
MLKENVSEKSLHIQFFQCSGSAFDTHSSGSWIRIPIPNAEPDRHPGAVKSADTVVPNHAAAPNAFHTYNTYSYIPTTAKPPPLCRIVHVPPCTAESSLQTRGKVFFLLYLEGGSFFLCPRWNMTESCVVDLDTVRYLW